MTKIHSTILFLFVFNIYSTIGQEIKISPLLETTWDQNGLYTKYSPENERIGCWSTAFAQIFYYHGLFPKGQIKYTLSNGKNISINLDTIHFSTKIFPEKLIKETSQNLINDVALYSFCAATIIQKDFGTGGYIAEGEELKTILEKHYDCIVNYYGYNQNEFETKYDSIVMIVRNEIDNKHPLFFYVESSKRKFGHAVAIDGYKLKNNHFYVHLNMGWNGKSNGWYRFDKRIFIQYNDKERRILYTVKV